MFKKKKIGKKIIINISNLIKIQKGFLESKTKASILTLIIGILSAIFIILVGFGFLNQISNTKFDLNNLLKFTGFNINFNQISLNPSIKKSQDGKTNILIIGRGGKENDAPDLTDSIIVASVNYNKKILSMFSIPRDLYIDYPTGYKGRINETYYRGKKKTGKEIDGINSLKEVVKKITGEDIHYYINLDFEGFREIIDTIGGIDINVPKSITDNAYPGPNWGYQTFSINAGPQTLDGATALKYARSRHTTSDFDRSIRQQLILKAIGEKILSLGFITDPSKIKSMFGIIKKYITTDLNNSQIIFLSIYFKDLPKENIVSSNLNTTCFYGSTVCEKGGFLIVPDRSQFGGATILLQEGVGYNSLSDYSSIEKYTNLIFNYPEIYNENLKINIFNSTKISGLANVIANNLKKYGFNIPAKNSVGNTSGGDKYTKSKILYTTGNSEVKPKTVEALELFIFGGSEKVEKLPKYSKEEDVKIEIIIGDDYKLLNF